MKWLPLALFLAATAIALFGCEPSGDYDVRKNPPRDSVVIVFDTQRVEVYDTLTVQRDSVVVRDSVAVRDSLVVQRVIELLFCSREPEVCTPRPL